MEDERVRLGTGPGEWLLHCYKEVDMCRVSDEKGGRVVICSIEMISFFVICIYVKDGGYWV